MPLDASIVRHAAIVRVYLTFQSGTPGTIVKWTNLAQCFLPLGYIEPRGKHTLCTFPSANIHAVQSRSLLTRRDRAIFEAFVYPLQIILYSLGDLVSKVVEIGQPGVTVIDTAWKVAVIRLVD